MKNLRIYTPTPIKGVRLSFGLGNNRNRNTCSDRNMTGNQAMKTLEKLSDPNSTLSSSLSDAEIAQLRRACKQQLGLPRTFEDDHMSYDEKVEALSFIFSVPFVVLSFLLYFYSPLSFISCLMAAAGVGLLLTAAVSLMSSDS